MRTSGQSGRCAYQCAKRIRRSFEEPKKPWHEGSPALLGSNARNGVEFESADLSFVGIDCEGSNTGIDDPLSFRRSEPDLSVASHHRTQSSRMPRLVTNGARFRKIGYADVFQTIPRLSSARRTRWPPH